MDDRASFNAFEQAQAQFDRIADLMGLDPGARTLLRAPMHEHRFALPIRMDDHRLEVFQAFRIIHSDARGPALGGVRFHPMETVDTVRALAMWMTWQTALVNLPLGGAMGGVVCDPHTLSRWEQERVARTWVRRLARLLGPFRDVPSPDIMTSAQHMGWMLDEFEAIAGAHRPGAVTGKPLTAGGATGRTQSTGYGLVYILREALKELSLPPDRTTASVQGFGTVARHAIELYLQIGGTVRAVATWDQSAGEAVTYRREEGVDLDDLLACCDRFGGIHRDRAVERGYEALPGDAWLEQDVDILVPAALENQIGADHVDRMSARVRLFVEGANGPTSDAAEAALLDRGVFVVPDVLANAGGVTSSYFESVQGAANVSWRLSEVLSKLDHQLTGAYLEISELAREKDLSLRDAALVIAVDRVASACTDRGWI